MPTLMYTISQPNTISEKKSYIDPQESSLTGIYESFLKPPPPLSWQILCLRTICFRMFCLQTSSLRALYLRTLCLRTLCLQTYTDQRPHHLQSTSTRPLGWLSLISESTDRKNGAYFDPRKQVHLLLKLLTKVKYFCRSRECS